MGEGNNRRVVGVVGGGPLFSLLGDEIRRKGLPVDLVALNPGESAGADVVTVLADAVGSPPSAEAGTEISVIAVRSASGEIRAYPVAEILRQDGLPAMTIVPARIDAAAAKAAADLALRTLEGLQGAGVFAVLMTADAKGLSRVHEVVAGVHASGLYSIEACRTSQFEQHVRAILGMPLGETTLLYAAVVVHILGAPGLKGRPAFTGVEGVRSIPGAFVHLYGKKETSPGRLLGHLTLVDVDDAGYREALVHRAEHARRMIVQKEETP